MPTVGDNKTFGGFIEKMCEVVCHVKTLAHIHSPSVHTPVHTYTQSIHKKLYAPCIQLITLQELTPKLHTSTRKNLQSENSNQQIHHEHRFIQFSVST
jgi:hypothetical protein